MRILVIIIAVIAGYFAFQQYSVYQNKDAFNALIKSIDRKPINQFDLKIALNNQVTARCKSIENIDSSILKVDDCINAIESNKDDCDLRVFRLAPVEFTTSEEAFDYGVSYQKCVFGREFSNLVDKK